MKYSFGNKKLEKQFSDATEMKKAFGVRAKQVSNRIDEIRSSPNLAALMGMPAAECHPLSGKRREQWAVRISGNYRIIFELDETPLPMKTAREIDYTRVENITIVEIIDYH